MRMSIINITTLVTMKSISTYCVIVRVFFPYSVSLSTLRGRGLRYPLSVSGILMKGNICLLCRCACINLTLFTSRIATETLSKYVTWVLNITSFCNIPVRS